MLNARLSSSGGSAGSFPWDPGNPGGKHPGRLIPVHSVLPKCRHFLFIQRFCFLLSPFSFFFFLLASLPLVGFLFHSITSIQKIATTTFPKDSGGFRSW